MAAPPQRQGLPQRRPSLALATALAHLTALNTVEVDRKTRRIRIAIPAARADHPLDRAILRAVDSPTGARYEAIASRAKPILAEMERSLRRQGLWTRLSDLAPAFLLPFALATLPLLLGVANIGVGVDRGRPVGFLVLGCGLGLLANLAFLVPPKRSRYGDAVLDRLRATRPNARYAASRSNPEPAELASGIALYGLGALEGGDYAYLRPAIAPQPAAPTGDGGDGGSSCGSSSSCGGGCGGCGS